MTEVLPPAALELLRVAGETACEIGVEVYCAGGLVRDLLLRVANSDIDLVVTGDCEELARSLAEKWGARLSFYPRFRTAALTLSKGGSIDLVTARSEFYSYPAALPQISASTISQDLLRRDFSINAMAINLHPDYWGELLDPGKGYPDLQKRIIRVLHPGSFRQDPTRILRAIRFEQRYSMRMETSTIFLARKAISEGLLGQLSAQRLGHEIFLILEEKDPIPALQRMKELEVWPWVFPGVYQNNWKISMMQRVPGLCRWWKAGSLSSYQKALVYLQIILSGVKAEKLHQAINRLGLDQGTRRCLLESLGIPELARRITTDLKAGQLHRMLSGLSGEHIMYLILCNEDAGSRDAIAAYVQTRQETKVAISGYDLINLGIKPGPVFKEIFQELLEMRMDQYIDTRQDEINQVKRWILEGRFSDAMAD